VPQLYIILLVDHRLHQYGPTNIWSHAESYYCCVWFHLLFLYVWPRPYVWCLQLQCRGGLTGVCVAAVSEPGTHLVKRPSYGSIRIQSHMAEVSVEPGLAVVDNVRKMITKSGKSWAIYSQVQVTMEWMTVNLHVLLKFYPAAYSCMLQVIPTVPQFAVSRPDIICL